MKALVVYESFWGNTAEIASAIAEGIGDGTTALTTSDATPELVESAVLIVAGAPLLGFSLPTESMRKQEANDKKAPKPADLSHPSMRDWLEGLPRGDKRFSTFETAYKYSPGSAKGAIAKSLKGLGYREALKPQRFQVAGMYGPMREGELERARAWGKRLAEEARA
jgi:flavodoxin